MTARPATIFSITIFAILLAASTAGYSQSNTFTYQGKLTDNSLPANGTYLMQFSLYDSATNGNQIGQTQSYDGTQFPAVQVTNGIFSVQLNFGSPTPPFDNTPRFDGNPRWLAISMRAIGQLNFQPLAPRQPITSEPYSIRSASAAAADTAANASNLGGVAANEYVVTTDTRLSDTRTPTAGSPNYIQNGSGVQPVSTFNVSGAGKATIFDAATQYNIANNRVLANPGTRNLFAGAASGSANNSGVDNSFFGTSAGNANNTGFANSFFGSAAGQFNNSGAANSFFGNQAGVSNSAGTGNSFFGTASGLSTTTSGNNSFFGYSSGFNNVGGQNNFFGSFAGYSNTSGISNSFFGYHAGYSSDSSFNSFFGNLAGAANTSGASNDFFGYQAGTANSTGISNSFFGNGSGVQSTGSRNAFFGSSAGSSLSIGDENVFIGRSAGGNYVSGSGNISIGFNSTGLLQSNPTATGNNNIVIGTGTAIADPTVSNTILIGSNATAFSGNQIVIGSPTYTGTTLYGNTVVLPGSQITLGSTGGAKLVWPLNVAGNNLPICWSGSNAQISLCSSSARYKENIRDLTNGLKLAMQLRPVSFSWKSDSSRDIGLIAEEVGKVNPLLTIYDKNGRVEGVKYDRVAVVAINAIREQQTQIDAQKKQIVEQQEQIDALKNLLCTLKPKAALCRR